MKLWDYILKRLFLSSPISGVILILMIVFAIVFPAYAYAQSLPPFVFPIYGAYVMVLGFVLYSLNQNEMRKRMKATATVVDIVGEMESDWNGDEMVTGIMYHPILQFIDTRTGQLVRAHYRLTRTGFKSFHRIGKTFNILYDPERPTYDVRVDSFWNSQGGAFVAIIVFGGLVLLVSLQGIVLEILRQMR